MVGNITVKTNRGYIEINNLKEVWIEPAMLCVGNYLCYSDDIWERKTIYFSDDNKQGLRKLGKKLIEAYDRGETRVNLTT